MWRRQERSASRHRQVLVIGLGNFGRAVAAELTRRGHEVLGVDVEPAAVEAAVDICARALELDATEEGSLRELGASDFDAAVIAIKDSARAILVTFIVRDLGIPSIVARAQTPTDVRILERVPGTRAVLVEETIGRYVARSLDIAGVLDVLPLTEDIAMVKIRWPADRTAGDVHGVERAHPGVTVLAIRRADRVTANPGPTHQVLAGDELVMIGSQSDLESLRGIVSASPTPGSPS